MRGAGAARAELASRALVAMVEMCIAGLAVAGIRKAQYTRLSKGLEVDS